MKKSPNDIKCHYDYANKCDCSDDDKCGCDYPNNLAHNFSNDCFNNNVFDKQTPSPNDSHHHKKTHRPSTYREDLELSPPLHNETQNTIQPYQNN